MVASNAPPTNAVHIHRLVMSVFGNKQKNPARRAVRIAALTYTSITAIAKTDGRPRSEADIPPGNGSYTDAMATSAHPPIRATRFLGRLNTTKSPITRVMNLLARKIICDVLVARSSWSHTLP